MNSILSSKVLYCEEKYPVQSKYSLDFESETETDNKGKQKVKQHSKTAPNTPILPKTTAKHLQTPEQETSKNESDHSENLESEETESEQGEATENKKEITTAYIAKIPEFTGEDNNTSPQEWLDKVQKAGDTNGWIAARMLKAILYILQGTAEEWFENLEEPFENWQFIAELKDKLIKKVCPHAPADLATAIRHVKSYKIAMEEANHSKLTNSQKRFKATSQTNNNSNNNHKDINPYNDATKTILDHHPTTNLKIVIIVEFQDTGNKIVENYKETNKTEVINVTLHHNNFITNLPHQLIIYQDHKIKTQQYQQLLPIQPYQTPPTQQYQSNNNRINPNNQLVPRNSGQQRPNYYHTQSSYLTIPEESDFQQTALSEGKVAAPRSNPSNHNILPAQIAQNANLSDIFLFEFEANKSPFLFNNTAVNQQKAITAMYTEAIVERKLIRLILDSRSAGSIITYQLIQQLKRNVNRPAQTVIVTADDMKKTPVREIDNFLFSIDGITIPVKVLVMDAPQY
ncbi:hypothetical protein G9A89_016293 [Geosiphon pyriformis]|nr:hypothetical protein G9A89_016293 [Geosiphon pyriformis]